MSTKNKKYQVTVLWLSALLLTGCWDNKDVTQVNFATAIGVDKTAQGRIEMTAEIPKPALAKVGQKEGGGGEEKAVFIVTSRGDTMFIAGRSMMEKLEKRISPVKQELLYIGEEQAREGLMEVLDFLERDPETNISAQVVIALGAKIQQIMEAESEQERIPTLHIVRAIAANQEGFGSTKEARLIDVLREINSPGRDPLIPVIQILEKKGKLAIKDMIISGTAAFKGDKLAGYLTASQTRGWLLAENKARQSVYSVPSPVSEGKKVSFEQKSAAAKKEVEIINGQPRLKIEIEVIGEIGGSQESSDLTKPLMLASLEEEVEKVIRAEVESTLVAVQEYQTDVYGFGEIVHRKYPAEWKLMKDNWNEIFSRAPYELTVKVEIKRSGYIRKPTEPSRQE